MPFVKKLHSLMWHTPTRSLALLLCLGLVACSGGEDTGSGTPVALIAGSDSAATTQQLIVKLKVDPLVEQYQGRAEAFAIALSRDAGLELKALRQTYTGAHVLTLPFAHTGEQARAVALKLAARADVEYAEPDTMARPSVVPNDTRFTEQWSLRETTVANGGANVLDAWDISQGNSNLVVAVVDTGVLRHADFGSRLLGGYDFISTTFAANDGGGRDADANDPGDWLTKSEATSLGESSASNSSFHGTHVAGTIGALGNNSAGVAGVNWKSKILPVRVLGKGGGSTSDIADGIAWAAGLAVPGVPTNLTPARVINLSLGGSGSCPRTTQTAIDNARARGAVIVVAAGNENVNAANSNPANCNGVITVAAVGRDGQRASYSNFGLAVTIASGGGSDGQTILSLGDTGRTSPTNDNAYVGKNGTSMATPLVAGVVSLMLSVNPALTPDQVKSILVSTARPFPTNTIRNCTTSLCGAGIVNAASAVKAAASAINSGTIGAVATAQSGWWWNPAEQGRGFGIEIRNGKLFFGGFLYDNAGKATWYVSGPTVMQSATRYVGTLDAFAGGQSLGGAFKSPFANGSPGQITLNFTGPGNGTLTWPGGTIPIQRFEFSPGGLTTTKTSFAPESGWWWNPAEPGRGFALEVQGSSLFMAGFMYDAAGSATWHLASGAMASTSLFAGNWVQYQGGQSLTGAFKLAQVSNSNVGSVRLQLSSTVKGTLTLPDGRVIPIEKYDVGFQSPIAATPNNKVLSANMLGLWQIDYVYANAPYTDYFLFDTVEESSTAPGDFDIWGVNQYDDLALAGWSTKYKNYSIFVSNDSFSYDDFYIMDTLSGDSMSGCYYYVPHVGSISRCYPLTGLRLSHGSSIASLDLNNLNRSVQAIRQKLADNQSRFNMASGQTGNSLVRAQGEKLMPDLQSQIESIQQQIKSRRALQGSVARP